MSIQQEDFFNAVQTGDRAAVAAALDEHPQLIESQSVGGLSPVLAAVYNGQPEIVDLLVTRGAILNIFEAAAAGSVDGVRSALAENPSVLNSFSHDGFQPLGLACFFGHRQIVELLLDAGAEVNTPSRNGLAVPPLNSAAAGQSLETARLLLSHGADPNGIQGEGFVPLHAAAENGQVEMVRLLLEYDADPSIKTKDGQTARDLALASGSSEAAALLGG